MKYKNVNIFKPEYINPKDKNLPIFVGERSMVVASRNDESGKITYTKFYEQLGVYIVKVPTSPARNSVKKLYDRNLIFLGRDVTVPGKNGIIGSFILNKTKFAGIVLDTVELEINYETGETSNIDLCFYTSYFEFIRAAVTINSTKVKQDRKLHDNLIKYLFYICLRLIGTNVNFSSKQKDFLDVLCSYFFYRFLIGLQHIMTKETIYKRINKELQQEVEPLISRLDKYKLMRDIFKGMIDFKLTNEIPPVLMMKALSKFRPTVFYALTSSLDYLIALAIVSKYPMVIFRNATVSSGLQTKIEDCVIPLINKTTFDTTSVVNL